MSKRENDPLLVDVSSLLERDSVTPNSEILKACLGARDTTYQTIARIVVKTALADPENAAGWLEKVMSPFKARFVDDGRCIEEKEEGELSGAFLLGVVLGVFRTVDGLKDETVFGRCMAVLTNQFPFALLCRNRDMKHADELLGRSPAYRKNFLSAVCSLLVGPPEDDGRRHERRTHCWKMLAQYRSWHTVMRMRRGKRWRQSETGKFLLYHTTFAIGRHLNPDDHVRALWHCVGCDERWKM